MPVDVEAPYEELVSQTTESTDPRADLGSKNYSDIPPPSPAPKSSTNVQYPSLPNLGTYDPPMLGPAEQQVFSSGEQQYPQATYPHQNHYQQRGEVYPDPTERSKLLQP